MIETPPEYVGPAFVGWRSWRILPFETLGGASSVRLSASGTNGRPKFWEPLRATHAVCGLFKTTHEAPWPDCSCGLHAYRTEDAARNHLMTFVGSTNGDGALGWAFGRVSLWGRIVEHEHGWRAEHAYPYELAVHGPPGLAETVRRLYAVDVEQQEPLPEPDEDEEAEPAATLSQTGARLAAIRDELATLEKIAGVRSTTPRPAVKADSPSHLELPWWNSDRRQQTGLRWPPERFFDVFGYGSDENDIATPLSYACAKHPLGAVTARELACWIMAEHGVADYQPTSSEASDVGVDLWRLAMRRDAFRFSKSGRPTRWFRANHYGPGMRDNGRAFARLAAEGWVEDDPTLKDADRDIQLLEAFTKVASGNVATAGDAIAALSEKLGTKQRAQTWSGAFRGCHARGWTDKLPDRSMWGITRRGYDVAALGRVPSGLSGSRTRDLDIVLRELASAVAEHRRPVTVAELSQSLQCRSDYNGHEIAARLQDLEHERRVRRERTDRPPLMWTLEAPSA